MKRPHRTALLLVTLGSMAYVAAGLPGLSEVRGWFYQPVHRGLGEALPLAVGATLVPALVWLGLARARRRRHGQAVLAFVVAFFAAQLTLVLGDARGLDAAFRFQHDGHGEMARLAHVHRDALPEILRDYETRIARRELGAFTPSKPPGAFAAYVGVEKLADALPVERWLGPLVRAARERPEIGEERADTAALAFVLFPLLTAVALPLVFALGRSLLGRPETGHATAVLTLSSPAPLLIQQHLDGALFPLLGLAAAVLATHGARRGAHAWTALGGAIWGGSLYVSFSLLPVVGLALGCVLVATARRESARGPAWVGYSAGWHALAFAGGALLALVLLVQALDFELGRRLGAALDYHAHWKRGVPTGPWRGWALLELAVYLSFPLAAALLWRAVGDVRRLATERFVPEHLLGVGLLAFLALLGLASGTNEVARLWLFTVPFVAAAVAAGADDAARAGRWWVPTGWMAGCQGVVALVLEANMPW